MLIAYVILLLIVAIAAWLSVAAEKLTLTAAVTGGVLAICIFTGAGYTGLALLGTFFIMGSAATSWKKEKKEQLGVAEREGGRRKTGQVLANGGMGGICGLGAAIFPYYKDVFVLMMAASFASAMADTLSSELGTVYGKRFYNILSLKKDKRGLDGVVSMEGFVIGIAGSILIAFIYTIGYGWSHAFIWIIIAGTVGNIADSLLGAALERQQRIKNNGVNFLNTFIAALTALFLYLLF